MKTLVFSKKNAPPELKEKAEQLVSKVLEAGELKVKTSGSTGEPKELTIPLSEIEASTARTKEALSISDGAVLCSLPLDYIAGIMQVFRAYFWELPLALVEPSLDPLKYWQEEETALATFTTMQWAKSAMLRNTSLYSIKTVILGGSAIPADISVPKGFSGSIYASYGMTETVSHIALRQLYPKQEASYVPLPGVKVKLEPPMQTLSIKVGSQDWIKTTDTAAFVDKGFTILGRVDNVLNSGGLKIQPEPMEQLYSKGLNCQVVVIGVPDRVFGQKVVLVLDAIKAITEIRAISAQLSRPQEAPKGYYILDSFPKTSSGKIDRLGVRAAVSATDFIPL